MSIERSSWMAALRSVVGAGAWSPVALVHAVSSDTAAAQTVSSRGIRPTVTWH